MKGPTSPDTADSADYCNETQMTANTLLNSSPVAENPYHAILRSWLNKSLKIEMSDGRILIGTFLCTDRDGNLILGSCQEFLKTEDSINSDEPRVLGLVMVPGRHIVHMHIDKITQ